MLSLLLCLRKHAYNVNSTQWVDGEQLHVEPSSGKVLLRTAELPAGAPLHADAACDAHGWGDNFLFPSHASPDALSAMAFGARGDGVHDDTVALQRAVDAAAQAGRVLFLPRGVYRTSRPVRVPRGVRLAGLARHLTGLVASDGGGPRPGLSTA